MNTKRYTIEHNGKFHTVNGQSAVTVGARFLRAIRVHFVQDGESVTVQNHHTREEVTVTPVPF